ncbi:MAG: disulfide bond formation protein B, partial [Pseudomonadota bacterium]
GAAQQWATLSCLLAGFLMTVALFMEHVMGLPPCPLCMMQRLWVIVVGLISYLALAHNPRWGIYPVLNIGACLVGGGFSIRQLWLQSLPVEEHPACGPDLQYMLEAFPLSDVLIAMTSGTGDCALVSWSLLGISIPGWTLIGFILLLIAAVNQFRLMGR